MSLLSLPHRRPQMIDKRFDLCEDMVLERPQRSAREGLAHDSSLASMSHFIHRALKVVGRRGRLEGLVCCGLLHVGCAPVDF